MKFIPPVILTNELWMIHGFGQKMQHDNQINLTSYWLKEYLKLNLPALLKVRGLWIIHHYRK